MAKSRVLQYLYQSMYDLYKFAMQLHNNIPLCAHSLFQNIKGDVRIYWVPGHAGLLCNEGANQLARDTALRASCNRSQPQEPTPPKPITLQDLRDHPNPYVRPNP